VHLSGWQRPPYWLARLDLARVSNRHADVARAEEKLLGLARRSWEAGEWTARGRRARLEMLTAGPAGGLVIDLAEVPEGGTVVELWLDGASRGTFPAGPERSLALSLPLRPGFHVLEIENVGGGRVLPGAVRLR
jgi:hypothetical protein